LHANFLHEFVEEVFSFRVGIGLEPALELAEQSRNLAKVLEEDEQTGSKRFRYVRVGEDHFSLAFTYACMEAQDRFMRELPFEWIAQTPGGALGSPGPRLGGPAIIPARCRARLPEDPTMRAKASRVFILPLLLAQIVIPRSAETQTAWFWSGHPYSGNFPLSTLGIFDRVATPQQTVFGSVPGAGVVGEVAVQQSLLSIGDLVPLPIFADGTQAIESEIFWTAQLWHASFEVERPWSQYPGNASATFAGRQLTGADLSWGCCPARDVQILVNVVAVRPHDNRRSNR